MLQLSATNPAVTVPPPLPSLPAAGGAGTSGTSTDNALIVSSSAGLKPRRGDTIESIIADCKRRNQKWRDSEFVGNAALYINRTDSRRCVGRRVTLLSCFVLFF